MGGYVAQQIAVDRPELVGRLILVGTGPRGGDHMAALDPDVAPLFGKTYEPQDLMWLPILSRLRCEAGRGPQLPRPHLARGATTETSSSPRPRSPRTRRPRASGGRRTAQLRLPARDHAPTLVVNGSNDIVVATVNSYILQQEPPNVELVLFPDSNHGSHFQYAEQFNRYAIDFLER
jgi:pimeloyl-ACP methyl ester carboxylesterase